MAILLEWWRKGLYSPFKPFVNRIISVFKPAPVLCTVTFLYTVKNKMSKSKYVSNASQTHMAYVPNSFNMRDLMPLFKPENTDMSYTIKDVRVEPVKTITADA